MRRTHTMFDPVPLKTAVPLSIAAPVVAGLGLVVSDLQATRFGPGPAADYWQKVRAAVLPRLDALAEKLDLGYAADTLHEREYAGTLDVPPEKAEKLLYEAGGHRNPFAAYKTLPDGREEIGSWAHRDGLLARTQVHAILFPTDGEGTTAVYVHEEPASINPRTALDHYLGHGDDLAGGIEYVQNHVDDSRWAEQADVGSD